MRDGGCPIPPEEQKCQRSADDCGAGEDPHRRSGIEPEPRLMHHMDATALVRRPYDASAVLGLDPGASVWVFTGTAIISRALALLFFRWE